MGWSVGYIHRELRKHGIEKAKPKLPNVEYGWNIQRNKLVKNAKEQKVLCEIRLLAMRKFDAAKIAKVLNDRRIPTKFSGKWWPATVSRLLKRINQKG